MKHILPLLLFTPALYAQLPEVTPKDKASTWTDTDTRTCDFVADSLENRIAARYTNTINPGDTLLRRLGNGIYITGTGQNLRALNPFSGKPDGGTEYAKVVNICAEKLGQLGCRRANVYCMVVPLAAEFYTPLQAQHCTSAQRPVINNIYAQLSNRVKAVDVYTPLSRHAAEHTYSRTDHHWAPLGAYYAAQRFARIARVPFKPLGDYERKAVRAYVGSMWHYTKDQEVLNSRDSFEYYVPKNVDFATTYTYFNQGKNKQVLSEKEPEQGEYFVAYADSSFNAYCTFGGGDEKMIHVKTNTCNGRKLLVIKDSFGNALAPFLFGSFEDIFVADFRYFKRNMVHYAEQNNITDVLIVNNAAHAYSPKTAAKLEQLLTQ